MGTPHFHSLHPLPNSTPTNHQPTYIATKMRFSVIALPVLAAGAAAQNSILSSLRSAASSELASITASASASHSASVSASVSASKSAASASASASHNAAVGNQAEMGGFAAIVMGIAAWAL